MMTNFVLHTSRVVWSVAMSAAFVAAWRIAYLVNGVSRPDPWYPLSKIWELGGWPMGTKGGSFLVFLPEPTS
jgi:hypothetical protein